MLVNAILFFPFCVKKHGRLKYVFEMIIHTSALFLMEFSCRKITVKSAKKVLTIHFIVE